MQTEIPIKIKRLQNGSGELPEMPQYATDGSAGMDLHAFISEPIVINPGGLALIPTGLSIELPDCSYAAFIFARSGLGIKHGINLSNGVGVVDSDFRGEIKVGLCNVSDKPYTITPNDRIAQLVLMPVARAAITESDELNDTARGSGGFGSTGR